MRSVTADANLVAFCGLYCGACGAYLKEKCPGCHENKKATWCKIRVCCMEHKYASCADCTTYQSAMDCKKFNNVMSKLFSVIFGSDRPACIAQIKAMGVAGHAKNMAENKRQSIKRGS
jgi:hypothetical protein